MAAAGAPGQVNPRQDSAAAGHASPQSHVPVPAPSSLTKQSNLHQTTTVRNLVNLKKQSLHLAPRKDDANTLEISFTIDAVQECMCDIPPHAQPCACCKTLNPSAESFRRTLQCEYLPCWEGGQENWPNYSQEDNMRQCAMSSWRMNLSSADLYPANEMLKLCTLLLPFCCVYQGIYLLIILDPAVCSAGCWPLQMTM